MKKIIGITLISLLFAACIAPPPEPEIDSNAALVRYDRPDASILKGVQVPQGKKLFVSSGLVSPPNDTTAAPQSLARFGDTYTQSIGTLERIKSTLAEAGLGMEDVIYLGVFLAPDPQLGAHDFEAWFKAYQVYFNNDANPVKTARTTLGVAALARPWLLVEVECIAVYP